MTVTGKVRTGETREKSVQTSASRD